MRRRAHGGSNDTKERVRSKERVGQGPRPRLYGWPSSDRRGPSLTSKRTRGRRGARSMQVTPRTDDAIGRRSWAKLDALVAFPALRQRYAAMSGTVNNRAYEGPRALPQLLGGRPIVG